MVLDHEIFHGISLQLVAYFVQDIWWNEAGRLEKGQIPTRGLEWVTARNFQKGIDVPNIATKLVWLVNDNGFMMNATKRP